MFQYFLFLHENFEVGLLNVVVAKEQANVKCAVCCVLMQGLYLEVFLSFRGCYANV
jgi:hypothetical protein